MTVFIATSLWQGRVVVPVHVNRVGFVFPAQTLLIQPRVMFLTFVGPRRTARQCEHEKNGSPPESERIRCADLMHLATASFFSELLLSYEAF